jgi:hypothetical protein
MKTHEIDLNDEVFCSYLADVSVENLLEIYVKAKGESEETIDEIIPKDVLKAAQIALHELEKQIFEFKVKELKKRFFKEYRNENIRRDCHTDFAFSYNPFE